MAPKPPSSRKVPKLSRLLPGRVAKILGDRPTMPFEDDEDFDLLHAEMIVAYDPKDIQEHFLVRDIADAQWQILKQREMLSTAVEVKLPQAAHNLLGQDYMRSFGCNLPMAQRDLTYMVRRAHQGDTKQLRILDSYAENAGISHRHLKTEAFSLALPTVSTLWDLIAKAERRRDNAIRRLLDRRKYLAAVSRPGKEASRNVIEVPVLKGSGEGEPAEDQRAEEEIAEPEESP